MSQSYKQLYKELRDSEFGCVPSGFHETTDVYEMVQEEYPNLCDEKIQCQDVCGGDSTQPEWKHRIRSLQQDLIRNEDSRLQKLSQGWFYAPRAISTNEVTKDPAEFELGGSYNRWELNDLYGGGRYNGISTPAERDLIFIFTSESGEKHGYEDGFNPDDSFLYTGEGTEGDMTMDGGNEAILTHTANGEDLHLFEDTKFPWIVTYRGQYECDDHHCEVLPDKNDERRDAIRFLLSPVGGTEVELERSIGKLSDEQLYQNAQQASPSSGETHSEGSKSSTGPSYTRSEVVKRFALRIADGTCQACGNEAPFVDANGDPYLEVHHLHSRADGGPDSPDNVLAICPNCHRQVHHGQNGTEFNKQLIEIAAALYTQI